jgi:hypothetical protein
MRRARATSRPRGQSWVRVRIRSRFVSTVSPSSSTRWASWSSSVRTISRSGRVK